MNEILLGKDHQDQQEIVREIQKVASPSSAPYLRRTLEGGTDFMANYNHSGTGVAAKWFSHPLFDMGTVEAVNVLRDFAKHSHPEVRNEML